MNLRNALFGGIALFVFFFILVPIGVWIRQWIRMRRLGHSLRFKETTESVFHPNTCIAMCGDGTGIIGAGNQYFAVPSLLGLGSPAWLGKIICEADPSFPIPHLILSLEVLYGRCRGLGVLPITHCVIFVGSNESRLPLLFEPRHDYLRNALSQAIDFACEFTTGRVIVVAHCREFGKSYPIWWLRPLIRRLDKILEHICRESCSKPAYQGKVVCLVPNIPDMTALDGRHPNRKGCEHIANMIKWNVAAPKSRLDDETESSSQA